MGAPYYQFCPVAKAMELLDERWTMLVMRELLLGSDRFNQLRRGLPRMSPSLLSHRLDQLRRAGLVERVRGDDGSVRYHPTAAGLELDPVLESLSAWGIRWVGELGDPDLDPRLLLWDMHRNVDHDAMPARRVVLEFGFPEVGVRRWWMVLTPDETELCDNDPGFEVDVRVRCSLRALTEVWRGDRTWAAALRTGDIALDGPGPLRRAVPSCFRAPPYAALPRPVPAL